MIAHSEISQQRSSAGAEAQLPAESSDPNPADLPTARERLIVALDFPRADLALSLVDRLEGTCRWFKVGLELYLAEGNGVISELRRRELSVFLDLKLHDIPNTVASAVRSAARLGASMLTVHASGGPDMMAAAVEAAAQEPDAPTLLAVTVLTSMDAAQLAATGVPLGPAEQVERMAKLALACGVPGLVASAQEVRRLRLEFGQKPVLVIPGIRPHGDSAGDQKRIATPGEAISQGASYLVVGRPI
ncbi:MAG TPA: orotidine-5'-phosphate decarboxylase, partial [Acidobacteriaceae bacterium]|nr:orotidine-5'-phosphate decarboxylase [Acidobacteriaceae bacterium]